jgi:hypothetical protein
VTRAVLQIKWDNQICNNVLHYVEPTTTFAPDPAALAERLAAWWNVNIRPKVSSSCVLTAIITTSLETVGAPGTLYTTGLPMPGQHFSPQLPNNATLAMSLNTALRGRSFRGRIYHIGLTEGDVIANTIEPSFLGTLITAYQAARVLAGSGSGPTFQLAVLSYYANLAIRSVPVATPVTSISSDGIVDSQRRRLPKRGT